MFFRETFRDGNFTRGKKHCIAVCSVSSLFNLIHDVVAKIVKIIGVKKQPGQCKMTKDLFPSHKSQLQSNFDERLEHEGTFH